VESWKQKAPESIRWQEALAKIDDGFGDIHLSRAELDKARGSYNDALEIRAKLSQPDTRSAKRMLGLAVTQYKLASLEELAGKEPKVIADHRTRATGILMQFKKEGRLPPIAANWPEIFGGPHSERLPTSRSTRRVPVRQRSAAADRAKGLSASMMKVVIPVAGSRAHRSAGAAPE